MFLEKKGQSRLGQVCNQHRALQIKRALIIDLKSELEARPDCR